LESAETGQLTDKIRAQLVDAAHALMSSDKSALDSLPKGETADKPASKNKIIKFEDLPK
jgi:hypothetical protein